MVVFVPFLNLKSIKNRLLRAVPQKNTQKGLNSKCPVCEEAKMFLKYKAEPCGHFYCYNCLFNLNTCKICNTSVDNMHRVE